MVMEKLRIVIADNESIIRMDLREMLEEAGHEVVGEAIDGRKAVELTRAHRPDLVIMDIKMPQMDGITAARKISEEKLAPVLLLTAFSQPEIVEKAKDSGVLGYLVKPVQENNLFPAIEIAMSRWREMQGLEQELAGLRILSPCARHLTVRRGYSWRRITCRNRRPTAASSSMP